MRMSPAGQKVIHRSPSAHERMERRRFLALTTGVAALSGCESVVSREGPDGPATRSPARNGTGGTPTSGATTEAEDARRGIDGAVGGTVTDLGGAPLSGVTVETLAPGTTASRRTTTNGEGRFELDVGPTPVHLRLDHPDYVSLVRAVEPGRHALRLTPAEDTVSLTFGGDAMFGRRFYDGSEGPEPAVRIDEGAPLSGHREILRHVAPVFENADVASVNLETPLTTSPWRHPSKAYTFTSHPVAARALSGAGVDYAALGNNHAFDALVPGLTDTRDALSEAGVGFSGAGTSSDEAWEPAFVDHGGTRVALVSCTTEFGRRYDLDWSADRDPDATHTLTRETSRGERERLRFPGHVGVAEATGRFMIPRIRAAREAADVVVVQIHGGEQYQRTPPDWIVDRTDVAIDAGADVVVNHHPHVAGGLDVRNGALVAWSLGNLVFDQEIWETYRSYLLTVHVTGGTVRRAYLHPVLLDRYVPKSVTGRVREKVLWETAGLSGPAFSLVDGSLEYLADSEPDRRAETSTLRGEGRLYARESGWVEAVEGGPGSVRLGTDRLFTGGFDDCVVDGARSGTTLWAFEGDRNETGDGLGHDGSEGVSLDRDGGGATAFGPSDRVPVRGDALTLTGLYRTDGSTGLGVEVRWYEGLDVRSGLPDSREPDRTERVEVAGTGGAWKRARLSLDPPDGTSYVNVRLGSPAAGDGPQGASFDDWRLVDWVGGVDEEADGRAYDVLRVDGSADLRFAVVGDGTDVTWERLGPP